MSGKTTLAQILAQMYRTAGIHTLVLDPFRDPKWNAEQSQRCWITRKADEFLAAVKNPQSQHCALFADEGSESVGHYAGPMLWLATQSRHHGHKAHFISQAPQMLDPGIRSQCSQAFIFRVNERAMKILADEFCQPAITKAGELQKGEFLYVARFGTPARGRVDFAKRRLIFAKG